MAAAVLACFLAYEAAGGAIVRLFVLRWILRPLPIIGATLKCEGGLLYRVLGVLYWARFATGCCPDP